MKLSKKEEIKKIIVKLDCSIKDVVENLNKSRLKIVLVVDNNNKLLGTVVDGDIRRGLLKKLGLDNKIDKIIHRNPQVVNSKTTTYEVTEIMKINSLNHLPIVDENHKVIGLHTLDEMMRPVQRENKIVIMTGGLGKRLLPLTKNKPKALIHVFGRPMLHQIVLKAKKKGFKNFIFSINYLGNMIKDYFLSGKKLGVKINYIEEKKYLGTAGSLSYLKNLKDQTIIVTNCDVISDIDYGDAVDYHKLNHADATMVVRRHETKNPFGVVETKGNNFYSYREKPVQLENINTGIYIFESKVFKYLENEKHKDMPEFFMTLVNVGKKVIVYPIYELWHDLGQEHNKFDTKNNENLK